MTGPQPSRDLNLLEGEPMGEHSINTVALFGRRQPSERRLRRADRAYPLSLFVAFATDEVREATTSAGRR